jgi:hypothetical protein
MEKNCAVGTKTYLRRNFFQLQSHTCDACEHASRERFGLSYRTTVTVAVPVELKPQLLKI